MILPTKHLSHERALLTVGGWILQRLTAPMTVSALWEATTSQRGVTGSTAPLRYDSFVLALDLLYALGVVDLQEGRIQRTAR
ncbi:MAG: ABC-three component system middle component 6 [Gemmataceae bacterium]